MSETEPNVTPETPAEQAQEPIVEQKEESSDDADNDSKMTFAEFMDQTDPEFLTPEMKRHLDHLSGVKTDDEPDEMFEHNEPSFDGSFVANELRELIFGDGNGTPGLKAVDAKLLKLNMPAKYDRLAAKDHAALKTSLESKLKTLTNDINSIAENYFHEKDPTFKIHTNIKVTISEILERIGMPEESEEPDENMNPSRVPQA